VVWDFEDSNTCEIVVPFIHNVQSKQCLSPIDYFNTTISDFSNYAVGTLFIEVNTEMQANETAPQTVDVVVNVRAGSDIQYFALDRLFLLPYHQAEPTKFKTPEQKAYANITPKGIANPLKHDGWVETTKEKSTTTLANTAATRSSTAAETTYGEEFVSIRQAVKRFMPWYTEQIGETSTSDAERIVLMSPNPCPRAAITTQTTGFRQVTWIDYFSCAYAFRRGGTNIKFTVDPITVGDITFTDAPTIYIRGFNRTDLYGTIHTATPQAEPVVVVTLPTGDDAVGIAAFEQPIFLKTEGIGSIACPYYSTYHQLLNEFAGDTNPLYFSPAFVGDGVIPQNYYELSLPPKQSIEYNMRFFIAGRDDYEFSYFLGVPVMEYIGPRPPPTTPPPTLKESNVLNKPMQHLESNVQSKPMHKPNEFSQKITRVFRDPRTHTQ
jgi:hypothetical protein